MQIDCLRIKFIPKVIRYYILASVLLLQISTAFADTGNGIKAYLKCTYMDGSVTMSKIFLINSRDKTVENVAWGGFLNVETFNDKIISSSYSDKTMSSDIVINRITGEYNEMLAVNGLSTNFTGLCKKIPKPKPLF